VDAGGADHVDDARLRRQFGQSQRCLRHGEIDEALDPGEERQRIVADRNSQAPDTGELAHIGADRRRPLGFDAARELETFGLVHDTGESAAHAPRGAGNGDLHDTPSTMTTSLSAHVLKMASAARYSSEKKQSLAAAKDGNSMITWRSRDVPLTTS